MKDSLRKLCSACFLTALLIVVAIRSEAAMTSDEPQDATWFWSSWIQAHPVTPSPRWSPLRDSQFHMQNSVTEAAAQMIPFYEASLISKEEWLWLIQGFDSPEVVQLRPRLMIPTSPATRMMDTKTSEVEVVVLPYAPSVKRSSVDFSQTYQTLPRLPSIKIPEVGRQPEQGIFKYAPVPEAEGGGYETKRDLRTYSLWVILILILSGIPLERLIRFLRSR